MSSTLGSVDGVTPLTLIEMVAKKHILLLHAGGDSKRVPWANPMGKVFLPLPFLASDDQDGPVPLLFDHILAIASRARQAFRNEGGLSSFICYCRGFSFVAFLFYRMFWMCGTIESFLVLIT